MGTLYKRPKGKIIYVVAFFLTFSVISSNIGSEASLVFIEGLASWYSESSPGIKPTTANMEEFDHDDLTCAIWGLPFNTLLEVTNLRNGKSVTVRVNDRGPAKRLCRQGRVVDLTMAAFREIEDLDEGLAPVRLRVIRQPPA